MSTHVEGFYDNPPRVQNQSEAFCFRTGIRLQEMVHKAQQTAFLYRETLYIMPLGRPAFDRMLDILTSRQSDWATLRSLLEMASPVTLKEKHIHP